MKVNSGSGQIIGSEKDSMIGEDASPLDGRVKLPWVAPSIRSFEITGTLFNNGSGVDGAGMECAPTHNGC